jgi:hypothetical protein
VKIKNWDQFQHYKTGKNAAKRPEWIKLYTGLLDDIEFHQLDGADAKALMMLWLLASEGEGDLPPVKTIAFRLRLSDSEVISILGRLGHWVDCASYDVPRTEEELEENKKEKNNKNKKEKRGVSPTGDALQTSVAFERYNLKAKDLGLPEARVLTPERINKLRARLSEHGLSGWTEALDCIGGQPFLLGKNDRGWRLDFDFLLQPKSLSKVRECAYADKQISRFAEEHDELVEWAKQRETSKDDSNVVYLECPPGGQGRIGPPDECAASGHADSGTVCEPSSGVYDP